jgi:hypothetical protein
MPCVLVRRRRFDRSAASFPSISLLEFHRDFDADRARLLEHLRAASEDISVCSQVFQDDEKVFDWLRLHCDVRVTYPEISEKEIFPSGVWGLSGDRKTSRLGKFRVIHPSVEVREVSAHCLIRGELGETQRRLHAVFTGNFAEKFPIILWDDIDLTLGTDGRIVREVISDLLRLLESFRGLFVFTAETKNALPRALVDRVDEWEREDFIDSHS